MDIGSAFTFMFDDEEWVKKLAIGGGIALLLVFEQVGLALHRPALQQQISFRELKPGGYRVVVRIRDTVSGLQHFERVRVQIGRPVPTFLDDARIFF